MTKEQHRRADQIEFQIEFLEKQLEEYNKMKNAKGLNVNGCNGSIDFLNERGGCDRFKNEGWVSIPPRDPQALELTKPFSTMLTREWNRMGTMAVVVITEEIEKLKAEYENL